MVARRQHPIFSPVALVSTVVLLAGVGISVVFTGGSAFSPGPLTAQATHQAPLGGFASHAAFENNCSQCHAPLRGVDAVLCQKCHADVAQQRAASSGVHGRLLAVERCGACHPDHRGRQFDTSAAALTRFDHATTVFSLARHDKNYDGTPMACAACHTAANFAVGPSTCFDCHSGHASQKMADHIKAFGGDCTACHDGADKTSNFDHAKTRFKLATHRTNYNGQPFTCGDCHTGPDGKVGSFASFDDQTCVKCHAAAKADFMAQHLQTFGPACHDCHDGTGNMRNFDHSQVFVLDGAHAPLQCAACHADFKFNGLSKDCVSCHAEPVVHQGLFGTDCAACHTTAAWTPAALRQHAFPIDHGGQMNACSACHGTSYATYTCYTCHEHDPNVVKQQHAEQHLTQARLDDCVACHATGQKEGGEDHNP